MSDLISRLAARATGTAFPARPRVRSAFEPASIGDAAASVDLHAVPPDHPDAARRTGAFPDRPSDAPPSWSELTMAGSPPPARRSERSSSDGFDPAGDDGSGPGRPGPHVEPVGASADGHPGSSRPGSSRPGSSRPGSSRLVPSGRGSGPHEPVAASVVVAHPPGATTDRVPAPVRTGDGGPLRPGAGAGPENDPPSVQIHIGRLDVRANLVAAPPPVPSSAASTRDRGLSLRDYLDGKRTGP